MDRTLRNVLLVILPLGGIIILTFTWLRPMSGVERMLNTFIGAASILVILLRLAFLRILPQNRGAEPVVVKVEIADKG